MPAQKVVILGAIDSAEHEKAELANLDVEVVIANPSSDGEAIELVREADAVMSRGDWGRRPIIEAMNNCKVFAVYSHGFNHVDTDALTKKGIMLTNGSGMCAEEVADQAAAFILALNRSVVQSTSDLRAGIWKRSNYLPIKPLDQATLGLIGFGNIARRLARKMSGWRMTTIVYDPYVPLWITEEYGVERAYELNQIFHEADYATVIVPLNDETRHMIGEEQFNQMKPSAYFVNVCRGAVVDETALISALKEGKIRGAGLDVFEEEPTPADNPLLQMPNVITAPHIAGASERSYWLSRQRAGQQVASVLRGEWPQAVQNPIVAHKIESLDRSRTVKGRISG